MKSVALALTVVFALTVALAVLLAELTARVVTLALASNLHLSFRLSFLSILESNWFWIWIWLWIDEISSIGFLSGVGSLDSSLSNINGLFFLLFLPLSGSLGEISITLSNLIDLNISLYILLLWWSVHKGSGLGDVSVLIIIDASVLWISNSDVVFVIRVKSIVSSLVHLSERPGVLLLLALGWWWGWRELTWVGVDVTIIIHRGSA